MHKQQLLETYRAGVDRLFEKLKDVDDDLLEFRPDIADAWTIKEHVIHLVDSELNGFIRLKSIIAQPKSTCFVMDEDTWTKNIRRKHEDVHKYLAIFKLIREMAYDLLVDEDEGNWDKDYFVRPYHGEVVNVTIEKWLDIYINHLTSHLGYLDRNIRAYNKRDGGVA